MKYFRQILESWIGGRPLQARERREFRSQRQAGAGTAEPRPQRQAVRSSRAASADLPRPITRESLKATPYAIVLRCGDSLREKRTGPSARGPVPDARW